jgi:hypothetical protein
MLPQAKSAFCINHKIEKTNLQSDALRTNPQCAISPDDNRQLVGDALISGGAHDQQAAGDWALRWDAGLLELTSQLSQLALEAN